MIDLFPDEGTESQEFPIDAMQNGLEEIAFSRIFTVEQVQKLRNTNTREFYQAIIQKNFNKN